LSELGPSELKHILDFAQTLTYKVSRQLLRDRKHLDQLKVTHKQAQGVVSEADLRAEATIVDGLKKKYPHHNFLAEETSFREHGDSKNHYLEASKKEWLWIIDPLDGTNNFLNGLDYFAISMALCYKGETVLALVVRPATGEVFHGLKGKGSFYRPSGSSRNQKIYSEKSAKKFSECLLSTGFVSEKGEFFDQEFQTFKTLMSKSRGLRRMGSAVLDLCYVALGQFDGFWERGLAPWDTAAASFICQLSGVKVTDYNNKKFSPFSATIAAARKPIHTKLRKELPQ
jgi:myo-inositol-1(or 4)-monophosphatase